MPESAENSRILDEYQMEADLARFASYDADDREREAAFMARRGAIGTVGVESYRGKLRLRMPRTLFGGKQKYVYTRLDDDNEGWHEAYSRAMRIESDIRKGVFDFSLKTYQPRRPELTILTSQRLTLLELWDKYSEYRRSQVAETTFKVNYQLRYRNAIAELPTQRLQDAILIRDYLLRNKTAATAKQLLVQFNACCNWAVKSQLIKENPFSGMASDLRVIRSSREDSIHPFTPAERDAIIQAFEEHPHYQHYTPFVKFLFWTGCRTSEAVGLRWGDVNQGCTLITFSSVISKNTRKGTKTGKSRKFPCNQQLQSLLQSVRPSKPEPDSLVFPNPIGNPINPAVFLHNAWSGDESKGKIGIVTQLVKEGKVERYRPQYNTRHTFITMTLEMGVSPTQVGRWVGTSTETISRHYAGVIRQLQVPEF
ncbi:tyrosine-type recombinase/integrase [Chroococcidiopsis sp. CCMEE 29]|uniref:site-specific integrase n=1 Tax=Chroococcidiopsis sp. CCMEE 29 TaxID=155894 RepID=UPI00202052AE|nr:tyrosine-type recombinase/integrase [Chroococcidiopsis sp. CCMEE 29]